MSCLQDYGPVLDVSVELYKHGKEHSSPGPSLRQTIQLIVDLLAQRSVSYIILDALDECSQDNRRLLLDVFREIIQQTSSETRLFISSRDDQDIKVELTIQPAIEVKAAQNRHDIDLFIEEKVSKAARKAILLGKADQGLILLLKNALHEGANGMCVLVFKYGSQSADVELLGFAGSNCSCSMYVRCGKEQRLWNVLESYLKSLNKYTTISTSLVWMVWTKMSVLLR